MGTSSCMVSYAKQQKQHNQLFDRIMKYFPRESRCQGNELKAKTQPEIRAALALTWTPTCASLKHKHQNSIFFFFFWMSLYSN